MYLSGLHHPHHGHDGWAKPQGLLQATLQEVKFLNLLIKNTITVKCLGHKKLDVLEVALSQYNMSHMQTLWA